MLAKTNNKQNRHCSIFVQIPCHLDSKCNFAFKSNLLVTENVKNLLSQMSYAFFQYQTTGFNFYTLFVSNLDYCHCQTGYCFYACPSGLLQCHPCGTPDAYFSGAVAILHAAARTVLNLKPRDDISCALCELHWFPIIARIQCKLCLLIHNSCVGHSTDDSL